MRTFAGMWKVLGVMSGSSLDGLDVALCSLGKLEGHWKHGIERARTYPFPQDLRERLSGCMEASGLELARLHRDLGVFIGAACRELAAGERIELISSHGHTVFHRPGEGLTTQIGCGAHISATSGITTVCDFRTKDAAFNGQGAPLVPLGEKLLFPEHDCFVNLGGISNVSFHKKENTVGYDVGPCNMMLNTLAAEAGKAYDEDGRMAASGQVNEPLLAKLEALGFYQQARPRSLGREWFNEHALPLIGDGTIPLADRMRTVTEHIALRLAAELNANNISSGLFTGGGAHNDLLIERCRELSHGTIVLPVPSLIDFKEALVFALLGLLRLRGEATALASVTGASCSSIGGCVYLSN